MVHNVVDSASNPTAFVFGFFVCDRQPSLFISLCVRREGGKENSGLSTREGLYDRDERDHRSAFILLTDILAEASMNPVPLPLALRI
jgi:hypothetical protein